MRALALLGTLALLIGGARAQDGSIQSGVKVGDVLPGPFDVVVINGKVAKDRQHCLVTEFGLLPVAMIFAREPSDGQDAALDALLAKLDQAASRHKSDTIGACVIILSPFAQNSTNNVEEEPGKLIEEALKRTELTKRLEERAGKLKNVVVAYMNAEGPKDYRINPKADVTVLVYERHKVQANFAFESGKMTAADTDRIGTAVDKAFTKK